MADEEATFEAIHAAAHPGRTSDADADGTATDADADTAETSDEEATT